MNILKNNLSSYNLNNFQGFNNHSSTKTPSESFSVINPSYPSTAFKYPNKIEEYENLQKRIREIQKINLGDLPKHSVILGPIPEQKNKMIIDESVKRLDIHRMNNQEFSNPDKKRRYFSLQNILKGVILQRELPSIEKIMKSPEKILSQLEGKQHHGPILNSRFLYNKPIKNPLNKSPNKIVRPVHRPYHAPKSRHESIKKDGQKQTISSIINDKSLEKFQSKEYIEKSVLSPPIWDLNTIALKEDNQDITMQSQRSYRSILNNLEQKSPKLTSNKVKSELRIRHIRPAIKRYDIGIKPKYPNSNASFNNSLTHSNSTISPPKAFFNYNKNEIIEHESITAKTGHFELVLSTDVTNRPLKSKCENDLDDSIALEEDIIWSMQPPKNPLFDFSRLKTNCNDLILNQGLDNRTQNQIRFANIRRKLRICLHNFRSLKLTIKEVLENPNIFSSKPFEKEGSYELIQAAKQGHCEKVIQILEDYSKYLVYDFDNVYRTALHAACKKGHIDIVKVLINYGADINAVDLIGRTPLYFAIKYQRIEVVKLLFYSRCDPWSCENINYKELCKNHKIIKQILRKVRKLHIVMKMRRPADREIFWEIERNFILNDRQTLEQKKEKQSSNSVISEHFLISHMH